MEKNIHRLNVNNPQTKAFNISFPQSYIQYTQVKI